MSSNRVGIAHQAHVRADHIAQPLGGGIASVLGCYQVLGELETQLASQR